MRPTKKTIRLRPSLRAEAFSVSSSDLKFPARAPYFHNGSASSLEQLVNFYEKRFQMNLSAEQKRQLVAFLNAL